MTQLTFAASWRSYWHLQLTMSTPDWPWNPLTAPSDKGGPWHIALGDSAVLNQRHPVWTRPMATADQPELRSFILRGKYPVQSSWMQDIENTTTGRGKVERERSRNRGCLEQGRTAKNMVYSLQRSNSSNWSYCGFLHNFLILHEAWMCNCWGGFLC